MWRRCALRDAAGAKQMVLSCFVCDCHGGQAQPGAHGEPRAGSHASEKQKKPPFTTITTPHVSSDRPADIIGVIEY